MQITILAPGSRGDVQPYVALGSGLKKAGHSVRFQASGDFKNLVSGQGLDFYNLGGNLQGVAEQMQSLLEKGNFLKILTSMGSTAKEMVTHATQSGLTACQGSDLIIGGLGGLFSGLALSEKMNIPMLQAFYYPLTPTREFPNAVVPLPPVKLPGLANKLTHAIAQQMIWQNYRAADNKARREILQISPAPFFGPFGGLARQKQTVLYGYSPDVIPPPKDWDDHIHVTGYWFLEEPAVWEPPTELVEFLQAGPPPVYIGFGSMANNKTEATTQMILQALAQSGQRGVLSIGWGGVKKASLPETVCMIDSVPFSWLFPQMAAVVHHGGAGTTSMGLWAGVPSIVTPFMGDQPFWAQQVYTLGVGPKPIPRRKLTSEKLANAIKIAVSDKDMHAKAARLGEKIRAEDGIGKAVKIIEERYAKVE